MKPDIEPMFTIEPDFCASMCRPKARQHVIGDPVDSGALRHVHHDHPGIVALCAQLVAPGLQEAGILVCDDSGGAGFRQSLDATKADASGTAGNECNPTRHFELLKVHRFTLPAQLHWRNARPCESNRWMRAGSDASRTGSPCFRPSSPIARAVIPSVCGTSMYRKVSLPRCSAATTVPRQPSPSRLATICSGRTPIVAASIRAASSPDTKFMRGEPMKPATKRLSGLA